MRNLKKKSTQNVYNTNLQLIFIKNFNQINRKQFCESLKENKKQNNHPKYLFPWKGQILQEKQTFFC